MLFVRNANNREWTSSNTPLADGVNHEKTMPFLNIPPKLRYNISVQTKHKAMTKLAELKLMLLKQYTFIVEGIEMKKRRKEIGGKDHDQHNASDINIAFVYM